MTGRAVRNLTILFLLLLAQVGVADGGFFGKGPRASELTIPDQRAIIVWNEGHQTLFVESNLRAAAGEYSWVIPLPAPPTEIGKARPSVMDLLFGHLPPAVQAREDPNLHLAQAALVVSMLTALLVLAWPTGTRGGRLAILLALPILFYVFYPVYGAGSKSSKASAGGIAPVQVLDRQTIGSYDVAVVKSDDPAALAAWLAAAGTPLPEHARKVVEAYVREGWCFMTARFRKEMDADAKPHPVRIKFPTQQPIYPMRLTGVVSDSLDLDLMVIGPAVAECKPLRLLRARRIIDAEPDMFSRRSVFGQEVAVRHVDIAGDLADSMVGTRLRATLSRSQMQQDFAITWAGSELTQPIFYTKKVARQKGITAGLLTLSALVLVSAGFAIYREPKLRWSLLGKALGMVLVASAVGGVVEAAMPTLEVKEESRGNSAFDAYASYSCAIEAFESAQSPDFDPFRVRFMTALERCGKQGKLGGQVESWQKDDIGGYVLREVAKDTFELQVIDPAGQVETLQVVDRPVTADDPVVRTTVRLIPGPERLLDVAKRAGILPDRWGARVEFVGADGSRFTAAQIDPQLYSVKLPAGQFKVVVKGHVIEEVVKWNGKDRLTVPFKRDFAARGHYDLSRYFTDPASR